MKLFFLNKSLNFIKTYFPNYSKDDLDKIRYGLEGLYLTITKIVVILLFSMILDITKEVIITILLFNVLRFFGFGMHSKSSKVCLIFSVILFISFPLIFIKLKISNFMKYFICIFALASFLFFAPSDTVKRPLTNKKKRIIRKIMTVIVGIIYSAVALYINNYLTNLILCSLVIEAIIINPITYKLFNESYANYKKV